MKVRHVGGQIAPPSGSALFLARHCSLAHPDVVPEAILEHKIVNLSTVSIYHLQMKQTLILSIYSSKFCPWLALLLSAADRTPAQFHGSYVGLAMSTVIRLGAELMD
jgi:hypothetical protein